MTMSLRGFYEDLVYVPVMQGGRRRQPQPPTPEAVRSHRARERSRSGGQAVPRPHDAGSLAGPLSAAGGQRATGVSAVSHDSIVSP
jgi:hypothetical protein